MIEVELQVPADTISDSVVKVVEQVCNANGLTQVLKGTLRSYPGCHHWHFRKDKEKGTLEITWWESENCLWFKVSKGRSGDWINESMAKLKKQIESSLNQDPKKLSEKSKTLFPYVILSRGAAKNLRFAGKTLGGMRDSSLPLVAQNDMEHTFQTISKGPKDL